MILHRDGTISFWSVYLQNWVEKTGYVHCTDTATFNEKERKRLFRHFERHHWKFNKYSWELPL